MAFVLKINNSITVTNLDSSKRYNVLCKKASLPLALTISWSGMEHTGTSSWLIGSFNYISNANYNISAAFIDSPYNQYYFTRFYYPTSGVSYSNYSGFSTNNISVNPSGTLTFKIRAGALLYIAGVYMAFCWQPQSHGPSVARGEKITASKMNDLKLYVYDSNKYQNIENIYYNMHDTNYIRYSRNPQPIFYPPVGDLIKYKHDTDYYSGDGNKADLLLADIGLTDLRLDMGPGLLYGSSTNLDTYFVNKLITPNVYNCYDLYGQTVPGFSGTSMPVVNLTLNL